MKNPRKIKLEEYLKRPSYKCTHETDGCLCNKCFFAELRDRLYDTWKEEQYSSWIDTGYQDIRKEDSL